MLIISSISFAVNGRVRVEFTTEGGIDGDSIEFPGQATPGDTIQITRCANKSRGATVAGILVQSGTSKPRDAVLVLLTNQAIIIRNAEKWINLPVIEIDL